MAMIPETKRSTQVWWSSVRPFMMHVEEGSYIYFGSGTKYGMLSNFADVDIPFRFRGLDWTSSEHAFQACLRVKEDDWDCQKCDHRNKMDPKDINSCLCKKCG